VQSLILKTSLSHWFVSLFLVFGLTESRLTLAQVLPQSVAALLRANQLPEDSIGIVVQPLLNAKDPLSKTGATDKQINWQANKSMQPASTLKLVTSIAALDLLGPQYQGSTRFLSSTRPVQGQLRGNMILRGRGDPDLNRETWTKLLADLKQSGVTRIDGDLLVDRQWFKSPLPNSAAMPFDESPEFRYNFIPDALSLNMNLVGLKLQSSGDRVSAQLDPPMLGIEVITVMTLNELPCKDWEDQWRSPLVAGQGKRIVLVGSFPKNCFASTQVNVLDRATFADSFFRSQWNALGGVWQGKAREANVDELLNEGPLQELAKHDSRALSEFIRDINKSSDNPITRLAYAAIGASEGTNDTLASADQRVIAWLESKQINTAGLIMDNGSGLSRSARISPSQMAQVLQIAAVSSWSPEFLASLPIVGVDGSMRSRLQNSPATARARIKTGGLRNVAAVAGYVTDQSGQQWVVVGIINHEKGAGKVGRGILDALIEWVAQK
jgi:serine-type D-Ala-D-Ala carboxypeptidase/endopeptidase (penicillin-binding protein 4)